MFVMRFANVTTDPGLAEGTSTMSFSTASAGLERKVVKPFATTPAVWRTV